MNKKRENFERLAENRVTEVIKRMRLVGNLANKHNYDYTDKHVKQIIDTIDDEIRILKSRFKEERVNSETTFSFKNK